MAPRMMPAGELERTQSHDTLHLVTARSTRKQRPSKRSGGDRGRHERSEGLAVGHVRAPFPDFGHVLVLWLAIITVALDAGL